MKITFPNKKEYEVAPLAFSEESCEYIEKWERLGAQSAGITGIGSFMVLFRKLIVESLSENYNEQEIVEALRSIRLVITNPETMELIAKINAAFLGIETTGDVIANGDGETK